MRQPLVFNAFAMNSVSHIQHGQRRHPQTRQLEYTALDPWVELAQILEGGGFDALFLADLVGMYGTYRADPGLAIREALQIPSNDPALVIPAMARATRHLGFAYTSLVYQEHPFNFARRAAPRPLTLLPTAAWRGILAPPICRTRRATSANKPCSRARSATHSSALISAIPVR